MGEQGRDVHGGLNVTRDLGPVKTARPRPS
jgi:hypothetical protein